MSRQIINNGTSINDSTAETLYSAFTKVNSMTGEIYPAMGHSVLGYGAVGNGSTNDTTAVQNAINAAVASSGTPRVLLPGNRTYCISSTLTIPWGVELIGIGQRNVIPSEIPPTLKWIGSAGGTMISVDTSSAGFSTYFENLGFHGGSSNVAATAVAFGSGTGNKIDSGTGFKNCWFNTFNGNALSLNTLHGVTNFFLEGGRFDAIYGGYGIYVNLTGADRAFIGSIWGNTNYVGGGAVQGKGFIHLDGEGVTSGAGESHLVISGLHSEINQDLVQTFASGANPCDQQGVIRLGVTPGLAYTQHKLIVNGWTNSSSGVKSYSAFQITAASGTDDDAAAGCLIMVNGGNALTNGTTDANATGEVRLFGGKVPARMRYPSSANYRHGSIVWGEGKDNTGEMLGSFIYSRHGNYKVRGLTLLPETYAQATQATAKSAGAMAYITDSNTSTKGATIAAGGSNKVVAVYNGTNWVVV